MKKHLYILLVLTFVFLFLGIPTNIHAEEVEDLCGLTDDEKIANTESWESVDAVSDGIEGITNSSQNAAKTWGRQLLSGSRVIGSALCTCCYQGSEDIPEEYQYGLLEKTNSAVIALFNNQPTINVYAHLAEEWVPGYSETSSVYANGYDDLVNSGIGQLWSLTRNIAYACYVIIMIVIGFMIMFRNKIGGQTMVTLGNALPKIIVSLILVTFSFAIMGLIIDVAGLARHIIAGIYYPGLDPKDAGLDVTNDPFTLTHDFKLHDAGVTGSMNFMQTVGKLVKALFSWEGLIKSLLSPIISVLVFVGGIKLWIMLLKSYLGLLVNVVLSPLSIMFGALPGNESSMMNVLKSALRNALAFPLAYAIVNLPFILDDKGLSLNFPDTLTGDQAKYGTGFATLLIEVAKIMAIFTAASAPDILKGIIPATAPKSGINIGDKLKESMGKVPFLGGMFK